MSHRSGLVEGHEWRHSVLNKVLYVASFRVEGVGAAVPQLSQVPLGQNSSSTSGALPSVPSAPRAELLDLLPSLPSAWPLRPPWCLAVLCPAGDFEQSGNRAVGISTGEGRPGAGGGQALSPRPHPALGRTSLAWLTQIVPEGGPAALPLGMFPFALATSGALHTWTWPGLRLL